jgi:hypothetical protein
MSKTKVEAQRDPVSLPYVPLPQELLKEENTCSVHLFTAGITTVLQEFIRSTIEKERVVFRTETEWLQLFTKFIEKR